MPATVASTDLFAARQQQALLAHTRLCAEYGAPFLFFSDKDPLSELISSLLSHRTKNADSHRAYERLRGTFPTWEAVRDAPTLEVQRAVSACTWPEQKAPRLQSVLREVSRRRGDDSSSDRRRCLSHRFDLELNAFQHDPDRCHHHFRFPGSRVPDTDQVDERLHG